MSRYIVAKFICDECDALIELLVKQTDTFDKPVKSEADILEELNALGWSEETKGIHLCNNCV